MIYFDNNATLPVDMQAFQRASQQCYPHPYNPSSIHKFGRIAKALLESARENILKKLGFTSKEFNLVFCSSATEANNLVFHSLNNLTPIISAIEHPSVMKKACQNSHIRIIPVGADGIVDLDHLESLLQDSSNILVSVMGANNETGIMQPLEEIKKLTERYDAVFHSDMVQIAGKIPFTSLPDMCTISAHKFGGPQGLGAVIYRKNIKLTSFIIGGGQERGIRSGTENIFGAVFASFALEQAMEIFEMHKCLEMRDYLEKEILDFSDHQAIIVGKNSPRLPNTSCIIMPNMTSDLQLTTFDLNNIAVSSGSACSSGKVNISHVLKAMSYSESDAKCAIRISLSGYNNYQEIDQFLNIWKNLFTKSQQRKAS